MRVLVTGSGGLLGRHTIRHLGRQGHSVIAAFHYAPQALPSPVAEILSGDLLMPDTLERLAESRPEAVVHLAASLPPTPAGLLAEEAAARNRAIDESMLGLCLRLRCPMVYASGTSVYPPGAGHTPWDEDSSTAPEGPYVKAKRDGELLGGRAMTEAGLAFTALRISAPYGPGQRARTVLNLFLEKAAKGLPLCYHGSGTREQDFTYADDVAEAIHLALTKSQGGVYNIASGKPVTMKELAVLVASLHAPRTPEVAPSGQADPQEGRVARFSTAKARLLLGWQARTDLRAGLAQCMAANRPEGAA